MPDLTSLEAQKELHQTLRETVGVTLKRMLDLIDQGAVVIDARPREAFEEGHLLLRCEPPVLNVPAEEIEAHVARLMDLQGLPVVLYCTSNSCDYAEDLYVALEEYGFTDIWIYFPGWAGIVEAGLETATGPDLWRGFSDDPDEHVEEELEPGENEDDPSEMSP